MSKIVDIRANINYTKTKAKQLGHDPVKSLEIAYNVIRERKGVSKNGIFIKD